MPYITLTTDWGFRDYYAGALKGRIYRLIPEAVITDISHQIARFNTQQAAYIFHSSWSSFPQGTLHIVAVAPQTEPQQLLALKKDGHIFIGPNNGVFSMVFDENPVDMVVVDQPAVAAAGYDLDTLAGVVDPDYRGEIKVVLLNTDLRVPFVIKPGYRIAQLVLEKYEVADVVEVEVASNDTERGDAGFGSTGVSFKVTGV
jgi:S-adenosylmethionine hydrolase